MTWLAPFLAILLACGSATSARAQTPALPGTSAPTPTPAADGGYNVGPRDLLSVMVFGEPTISGNYRVEADGGFSFPLIGRVTAVGRSLKSTEEDVRRRLADGFFRNPQVTVAVQEYGSQRVFVIGEVRTPGPYPLTGQTTVLAAIAQAGSTTPTAGEEVVLLRPKTLDASSAPLLPGKDGGSELLRIKLSELQAGLAGQNVTLQHGDTLYVPRAEIIFVTGQVRNAGSFPYRSGLTVLQALALAGGVTDRGSASRLRITRLVDGKEVEIEPKRTDLVKPGDTIIVLERFF
jgi:polysaccharide export outer membrane protein